MEFELPILEFLLIAGQLTNYFEHSEQQLACRLLLRAPRRLFSSRKAGRTGEYRHTAILSLEQLILNTKSVKEGISL